MKTRPNTWWNSATGDIDYCAEFMRIRFTIDSDWRRMSVWIYRVRLGRHWFSRVTISHVTLSCSHWTDFPDEWCGPWVSCSMIDCWYANMSPLILTRSQCRSSIFLTLILVFLHRIEQLKALVFDSSSDTSSSSPDSSCHKSHKRLLRNIGNTVHPHRGHKKVEI